MSDKDEALRLANALTECHHIGVGGPDLQAAALLRRQHAEIESLKVERDAMDQLRRAAGDRADGYKLLFDLSDAACKKAEAERDALRAACVAYSAWADAAVCSDPELRAIRQQMRAAIDAAREGK